MKITMSVCIKAPKNQVWDVLADIENIPLWSNAVISAETGETKTGAGATRTCKLTNQSTIFEKWTDWKENESYTYQGFDLPMVKSAQNTWSVQTVGTEETLLTTHADVVLKGGLLGRCLEPLVRLASKRMGNQALAAFKYLVEEGKPFAGKHNLLPKPMSVC